MKIGERPVLLPIVQIFSGQKCNKVYCRAGGKLPPMKLSERVLEELGKMVVGDAKHFPYRSSSYITRFFRRCDLSFVHDGSTRARWAQERLAELNLGAAQSADLPSNDL